MKFVITKTSITPADYLDAAPVPGAVKEAVTITEEIPTKKLKTWRGRMSVSHFDPIGNALWTAHGTNHRTGIDADGIPVHQRDFVTEVWTVDFANPAELDAFLAINKEIMFRAATETVHGMREMIIWEGELF